MTNETPREPSLMFRVAEALPKDVGRVLVRLDPQDLEKLKAGIGDIVEVNGKRATVARAMPAYAAQRGQGLIQMDGIVRANTGAGLGEQVTVRVVKAQAARILVLAPADGQKAVGSMALQARYLIRLLDGIPVTVDDQVRITLIGARAQNLRVVETTPAGPVLVNAATTIRIAGEGKANAATGKVRNTITYEDIGGLRREIKRIREMIELPLRYPELFERLGIEPPKGVLLYGPPGTGKTLIARAVADETSAYFVHVNGPEIIDKMYGQSESNLRGIFEEARRKAPAIIFIDEIDAIAPRRTDLSGDRQVERRVVAQLLAIMDGLESRGNVIVIAATNIPDTLDPALRRPGRFDREIEIGVPDRAGRREILDIHTRGMPLTDNVNLDKLANTTHGFVGADMAALCREAAMSALRRMMPEIDFSQAQIPYERLMALEVSQTDFDSALAEVEPSAMREVFTEVPDVTWDDVGGLQAIKQQLIETIEWPLRYGKLFEYASVRVPKGILLHGAPGTGKTLLAKALARQSEANFISIKGPQLLSMWVGESERAVREIFHKARQAAPCIVFFDELDAIAPQRGGGGNQVTERVVSQILTELDGIEELKGVVILAATNRLDLIDSALLRPGRFDLLFEMPIPDDATRNQILHVHTRKMPLGDDVDLNVLTALTVGKVGADIEGLCRQAAILAMREFLTIHRGENLDSPAPDQLAQFRVEQRHFQEVLKNIGR